MLNLEYVNTCICMTTWFWCLLQAGISAAPARAVSAVKELNLQQRIKDIKLPDLPNIGSLKF